MVAHVNIYMNATRRRCGVSLRFMTSCVTGSSATLGGTQNVNSMGTLGSVSPATKVVCSGDALKSCTLGKDNHATIDVQSAGPGQS